MADLSSRSLIGIGFGLGSVVAYVAFKAGRVLFHCFLFELLIWTITPLFTIVVFFLFFLFIMKSPN